MHIISKIAVATALAAATAAATLIAATALRSTASANPFEALFGQHRPTRAGSGLPEPGTGRRRASATTAASSAARSSTIAPARRRARSSSIPRTPTSTWSCRAARRCATASASAATASPGPARRPSPARPNGRTGPRRKRCCSVSPTCRASWPAARATRWVRAPCISARASIASTAPTRRTTIGQRVSSGCIRLTNDDVEDLYSRVNVGTKVVVLPINGSRRAGAAPMRIN